MKTPIRVGSLVIINEFDRPCARLIAMVESVKGEVVTARYLAKDVHQDLCSGPVELCTCVEDFGVKVVFHGNKYFAEKTELSKALYHNSKLRRLWQDDFPEAWELKDILRNCGYP